MKKNLIRAVIVIVLLLVVAVVVVAFSLGAIVKKGVETYGPRATQVAVKLDSAQVWLVGGKAELAGFFIGNPPGYTTPSAITVDKVSVSVQPGSVFSRKIIVKSVEVKAPVITLEGGLTDNNLKKIQKNLGDYNASPTNAPQQKPSAAGEPKANKALEVDDLVLSGAKLQINTMLSGGKTLTLTLPDIHLSNLGTGPDGITAAEVGQKALDAVLSSASTAVAKNASSLGQGVINAAKDAVKDPGKKATDLLKGVLNK